MLAPTEDRPTFQGMKVKTSVTLAADALEDLDGLASQLGTSRSALVERALREFVTRWRRLERDRRDRELLDSAADELNRETEDALGYQGEP